MAQSIPFAKRNPGARVAGWRNVAIASKFLAIVFSLVIVARPAQAQDAFAAVRCSADIPKALIGKAEPTGPVVAIEKKHHDIGLKNAGGTEISDNLSYDSWTLCGKEYALLVDHRNVIRDALQFPAHSRRKPAFVGACEVAGREPPIDEGELIGVLDNTSSTAAKAHYSADDNTLLRAISAWKIDKTRARFVAMPVEHLRCPRGNIITLDGGP